MKLLIDENLPPRLAALLSEAGHDAAHVRDLDGAGASDPQIVDLALADGRAIVSADTDFGALLASTGATEPSVILVREIVDLHPPELAVLLTACIEPHPGPWRLPTAIHITAAAAGTSPTANAQQRALRRRMISQLNRRKRWDKRGPLHLR